MGTFGSSMAGSMAGSMIGNALMGGRGGEAAPVAAGEAAGAVAAAPAGPVCAFETRAFIECMANSADNMESCRHMFEAFKHCNLSNAQMYQQP